MHQSIKEVMVKKSIFIQKKFKNAFSKTSANWHFINSNLSPFSSFSMTHSKWHDVVIEMTSRCFPFNHPLCPKTKTFQHFWGKNNAFYFGISRPFFFFVFSSDVNEEMSGEALRSLVSQNANFLCNIAFFVLEVLFNRAQR